jgi:hypothetical protein
MRIYFGFRKGQVIQALRYHFITRPEIKFMIILVNVFAILSVTLYALKKIQPLAFLAGSFLWIILMLSFWFFLPWMVYRRTITFRHEFSMNFDDEGFTLEHEHGSKEWPWSALKTFMESPHFFHLYFDSRTFFLVPKSGCKDNDEVKELRGILMKNIPPKK